MADGKSILVAGTLLAAGLLASMLAGRLRVPGLVLFLGLGMALGSDALGWIDFDSYSLARTIGVIALALILFEGGLAAGFGEIRPVLGQVLSLALLGTAITAGIAGLAAAWLFDLPLLEGMLIGSIVAATDCAAIFALLRGSTLRRRIARTLEGEASMNDPVAVLLVIGFIAQINEPSSNAWDFVELLVRQLGIGSVIGVLVGMISVAMLSRLRLPNAGLYPVATMAAAAIAFGGAEVLHGSGFLAVYICGLLIGDKQIPAKQTVTNFHQGLAWVGQIAMFLTLGLLVFPRQLLDVVVEGTLLALILVFVARPVAALIATSFSDFQPRERLVIGWAGLRGAAPVVLATFPVLAGVEGSIEFFNIVFFAVLFSTLLQGSAFEPVARWLGVTTNEPALPRPLAESGTIRALGAEIVEYPVAPDDAIVGLNVRNLELPREALLNVIVRDGQAIPPRGSTRIEAGDELHILVREEASRYFRPLLERWRHGPIGSPNTRPRPRRAAVSFTLRPWPASDGDAGAPKRIGDLAVVQHLRTRRDVPGALVVLEDGRHALTGEVLAIGSPRALGQYAHRRLRQNPADAESAWWQEVIGLLATELAPY